MVKGGVSQYNPEYCQKLIEHMAKGSSFETFGLIASVSKVTLYDWVKRYPEFAEAKQQATIACQSFFEKILSAKISGQDIEGFDPKKSDSTLLMFALKTRFHKVYGDRTKHEVEISEIKIDDQDKDL